MNLMFGLEESVGLKLKRVMKQLLKAERKTLNAYREFGFSS